MRKISNCTKRFHNADILSTNKYGHGNVGCGIRWIHSEDLSREISSGSSIGVHKYPNTETLAEQQEDADLISLLKACIKREDLQKGINLHADILKRGLLKRSPYIGDALICMYARCGELLKAQEILVDLSIRDVVLWTRVIVGFDKKGQGLEALKCFEQMRQQGILPDAAIFCCILKACGNVGAVDKGEEIHNEIFREGLLQSNVILGTTLINMYVKCGELAKAQQVLSGLPVRDAFAWSALIGGYAQQGQGEKALECYEQMKEDGVLPDAVTFLSVLKACGSIGATHKGKEIHDVIIKQELLRKKVSLGGALVDMYAKCGDLRKAEEVLSGLPIRDSISWSALITGYAQVGQGQAALNCFDQMQREGAFPNAITYSSVLKACGTIGAVDKGEQVHHEIVRQGLLKQNVVLGTALIDMYVKCGALAKAQEVLEQLPVGDVVAWSALISGYAERGCGKAALSCFEQMQAKGCLPDAILFSCILNACNHSGLVEEAQNFFSAMTNKFGLKPDVNHFLCMVDLLGRTGHLDKAVAIIHRMPSGKKSVVWPVLMDSCQKWGDVNIGKWVFDNAIQENKADVAAYLCMANIYAAAGMHEHAQTIKAMREANMVRERDFYTQLKDPHR